MLRFASAEQRLENPWQSCRNCCKKYNSCNACMLQQNLKIAALIFNFLKLMYRTCIIFYMFNDNHKMWKLRFLIVVAKLQELNKRPLARLHSNKLYIVILKGRVRGKTKHGGNILRGKSCAMVELVFSPWRTLIGCWEVGRKAYCPPGSPGAVRGQNAFLRTCMFWRENF